MMSPRPILWGNPNRLDLATNIAGSTNQILLFQSNGDGTFKAGQLVESSLLQCRRHDDRGREQGTAKMIFFL